MRPSKDRHLGKCTQSEGWYEYEDDDFYDGRGYEGYEHERTGYAYEDSQQTHSFCAGNVWATNFEIEECVDHINLKNIMADRLDALLSSSKVRTGVLTPALLMCCVS